MVSGRFAAALWVLTAVLLQLGGVNRLNLPAGVPNLALISVLALGVIDGPAVGMSYGFAAGLLGDLLSTHTLGRLALVWTLVGYGAGLFAGDDRHTSRSPLVPMFVVGAGTVLAALIYSGLAVATGGAHAPVSSLLRTALVTGGYDVVLTPFLYPPLRGLLRRLEPSRI